MKTVQDYLDFGLVFVDDDMIQAVTGEPSYGSTSLAKCLFKCGEYPSGIKLVGSMCGMGEWIPSSFAWRNNDGVNPEYKGLIDISFEGGIVSHNESPIDFEWSLDDENYIAKWRPVVLQSESPTVSTKEDKPMKKFKTNQEANKIVAAHIGSMKPVYTAEMHANGELPPVGAECILIVNDETRPAKVTYIGKNIVCCSNVDGNAEYAYLLGVASFKPIIKTIKVNGFDVPAPMSEAPELGSEYFVIDMLDEGLFCSVGWEGDDKDHQWLSNGIIHSTKSAAIAHAKAMLGIDPNA